MCRAQVAGIDLLSQWRPCPPASSSARLTHLLPLLGVHGNTGQRRRTTRLHDAAHEGLGETVRPRAEHLQADLGIWRALHRLRTCIAAAQVTAA